MLLVDDCRFTYPSSLDHSRIRIDRHRSIAWVTIWRSAELEHFQVDCLPLQADMTEEMVAALFAVKRAATISADAQFPWAQNHAGSPGQ